MGKQLLLEERMRSQYSILIMYKKHLEMVYQAQREEDLIKATLLQSFLSKNLNLSLSHRANSVIQAVAHFVAGCATPTAETECFPLCTIYVKHQQAKCPQGWTDSTLRDLCSVADLLMEGKGQREKKLLALPCW